jgi:tRNA nucleotidyltransferase/poly(A) polymerase
METLTMKLQQLRVGVDEFYMGMGDLVKGPLMSLTDVARGAVGAFNLMPASLKTVLVSLGGLAAFATKFEWLSNFMSMAGSFTGISGVVSAGLEFSTRPLDAITKAMKEASLVKDITEVNSTLGKMFWIATKVASVFTDMGSNAFGLAATMSSVVKYMSLGGFFLGGGPAALLPFGAGAMGERIFGRGQEALSGGAAAVADKAMSVSGIVNIALLAFMARGAWVATKAVAEALGTDLGGGAGIPKGAGILDSVKMLFGGPQAILNFYAKELEKPGGTRTEKSNIADVQALFDKSNTKFSSLRERYFSLAAAPTPGAPEPFMAEAEKALLSGLPTSAEPGEERRFKTIAEDVKTFLELQDKAYRKVALFVPSAAQGYDKFGNAILNTKDNLRGMTDEIDKQLKRIEDLETERMLKFQIQTIFPADSFGQSIREALRGALQFIPFVGKQWGEALFPKTAYETQQDLTSQMQRHQQMRAGFVQAGMPVPPIIDRAIKDIARQLEEANAALDVELEKTSKMFQRLTANTPGEYLERLRAPEYKQFMEVRGGRNLEVLGSVAKSEGITLEELQKRASGKAGYSYEVTRGYRGGIFQNISDVLTGRTQEPGTALGTIAGQAALGVPATIAGGFLGRTAYRNLLGGTGSPLRAMALGAAGAGYLATEKVGEYGVGPEGVVASAGIYKIVDMLNKNGTLAAGNMGKVAAAAAALATALLLRRDEQVLMQRKEETPFWRRESYMAVGGVVKDLGVPLLAAGAAGKFLPGLLEGIPGLAKLTGGPAMPKSIPGKLGAAAAGLSGLFTGSWVAPVATGAMGSLPAGIALGAAAGIGTSMMLKGAGGYASEKITGSSVYGKLTTSFGDWWQNRLAGTFSAFYKDLDDAAKWSATKLDAWALNAAKAPKAAGMKLGVMAAVGLGTAALMRGLHPFGEGDADQEALKEKIASRAAWREMMMKQEVPEDLIFGKPGAYGGRFANTVIAARSPETGTFMVSPHVYSAAGKEEEGRRIFAAQTGGREKGGPGVGAAEVTKILMEQTNTAIKAGASEGKTIMMAELTKEGRKAIGAPAEGPLPVTFRKEAGEIKLKVLTEKGEKPLDVNELLSAMTKWGAPALDVGEDYQKFRRSRMGGAGAGKYWSYKGQEALNIGADFEWQIEPLEKANTTLGNTATRIRALDKELHEFTKETATANVGLAQLNSMMEKVHEQRKLGFVMQLAREWHAYKNAIDQIDYNRLMSQADALVVKLERLSKPGAEAISAALPEKMPAMAKTWGEVDIETKRAAANPDYAASMQELSRLEQYRQDELAKYKVRLHTETKTGQMFEQLKRDVGGEEGLQKALGPESIKALQEDLEKLKGSPGESNQRVMRSLAEQQVNLVRQSTDYLKELVRQGGVKDFTPEQLGKNIRDLQDRIKKAEKEGNPELAGRLREHSDALMGELEGRRKNMGDLDKAMGNLTERDLKEYVEKTKSDMAKGKVSSRAWSDIIPGFGKRGAASQVALGEKLLDTRPGTAMDYGMDFIGSMIAVKLGDKIGSWFTGSQDINTSKELVNALHDSSRWERELMLNQSQFLREIANNTRQMTRSYAPSGAEAGVGVAGIAALGAGGYAAYKYSPQLQALYAGSSLAPYVAGAKEGLLGARQGLVGAIGPERIDRARELAGKVIPEDLAGTLKTGASTLYGGALSKGRALLENPWVAGPTGKLSEWLSGPTEKATEWLSGPAEKISGTYGKVVSKVPYGKYGIPALATAGLLGGGYYMSGGDTEAAAAYAPGVPSTSRLGGLASTLGLGGVGYGLYKAIHAAVPQATEELPDAFKNWKSRAGLGAALTGPTGAMAIPLAAAQGKEWGEQLGGDYGGYAGAALGAVAPVGIGALLMSKQAGGVSEALKIAQTQWKDPRSIFAGFMAGDYGKFTDYAQSKGVSTDKGFLSAVGGLAKGSSLYTGEAGVAGSLGRAAAKVEAFSTSASKLLGFWGKFFILITAGIGFLDKWNQGVGFGAAAISSLVGAIANIGSGAGMVAGGAAIGSMVMPGLGTLVGAGAGMLGSAFLSPWLGKKAENAVLGMAGYDLSKGPIPQGPMAPGEDLRGMSPAEIAARQRLRTIEATGGVEATPFNILKTALAKGAATSVILAGVSKFGDYRQQNQFEGAAEQQAKVMSQMLRAGDADGTIRKFVETNMKQKLSEYDEMMSGLKKVRAGTAADTEKVTFEGMLKAFEESFIAPLKKEPFMADSAVEAGRKRAEQDAALASAALALAKGFAVAETAAATFTDRMSISAEAVGAMAGIGGPEVTKTKGLLDMGPSDIVKMRSPEIYKTWENAKTGYEGVKAERDKMVTGIDNLYKEIVEQTNLLSRDLTNNPQIQKLTSRITDLMSKPADQQSADEIADIRGQLQALGNISAKQGMTPLSLRMEIDDAGPKLFNFKNADVAANKADELRKQAFELRAKGEVPKAEKFEAYVGSLDEMVRARKKEETRGIVLSGDDKGIWSMLTRYFETTKARPAIEQQYTQAMVKYQSADYLKEGARAQAEVLKDVQLAITALFKERAMIEPRFAQAARQAPLIGATAGLAMPVSVNTGKTELEMTPEERAAISRPGLYKQAAADQMTREAISREIAQLEAKKAQEDANAATLASANLWSGSIKLMVEDTMNLAMSFNSLQGAVEAATRAFQGQKEGLPPVGGPSAPRAPGAPPGVAAAVPTTEISTLPDMRGRTTPSQQAIAEAKSKYGIGEGYTLGNTWVGFKEGADSIQKTKLPGGRTTSLTGIVESIKTEMGMAHTVSLPTQPTYGAPEFDETGKKYKTTLKPYQTLAHEGLHTLVTEDYATRMRANLGQKGETPTTKIFDAWKKYVVEEEKYSPDMANSEALSRTLSTLLAKGKPVEVAWKPVLESLSNFTKGFLKSTNLQPGHKKIFEELEQQMKAIQPSAAKASMFTDEDDQSQLAASLFTGDPDRRGFLQTMLAAGATTAAYPYIAKRPTVEEQPGMLDTIARKASQAKGWQDILSPMSRREFIPGLNWVDKAKEAMEFKKQLGGIDDITESSHRKRPTVDFDAFLTEGQKEAFEAIKEAARKAGVMKSLYMVGGAAQSPFLSAPGEAPVHPRDLDFKIEGRENYRKLMPFLQQFRKDTGIRADEFGYNTLQVPTSKGMEEIDVSQSAVKVGKRHIPAPISEFLSRGTDLTANALGINVESGEVTGPLGAERDAQERILRVTNQEEFMRKQPQARILRAAKLMATKGFTPDPEALKFFSGLQGEASRIPMSTVETQVGRIPEKHIPAFVESLDQLKVLTPNLMEQLSQISEPAKGAIANLQQSKEHMAGLREAAKVLGLRGKTTNRDIEAAFEKSALGEKEFKAYDFLMKEWEKRAKIKEGFAEAVKAMGTTESSSLLSSKLQPTGQKVDFTGESGELMDVLRPSLKDVGAAKHAFVYGGAIRAAMGGKPINDIDMIIEKKGDEFRKALERGGAVESGQFKPMGLKQYNVPLGRTTKEGLPVMSELDTKSKRGLGLGDVLASADYTFNAMGADVAGNVYDPLGGSKDLKNNILRVVDQELVDKYLPGTKAEPVTGKSLLRGIRFMNQGFDFDPADLRGPEIFRQKAQLIDNPNLAHNTNLEYEGVSDPQLRDIVAKIAKDAKKVGISQEEAYAKALTNMKRFGMPTGRVESEMAGKTAYAYDYVTNKKEGLTAKGALQAIIDTATEGKTFSAASESTLRNFETPERRFTFSDAELKDLMSGVSPEHHGTILEGVKKYGLPSQHIEEAMGLSTPEVKKSFTEIIKDFVGKGVSPKALTGQDVLEKLPQGHREALDIIRQLAKGGEGIGPDISRRVQLKGGAIRGALLGGSVNDIDLATEGMGVENTLRSRLEKYAELDEKGNRVKRGRYMIPTSTGTVPVEFSRPRGVGDHGDFTINTLGVGLDDLSLKDLTGRGLADIEQRRLSRARGGDITHQDAIRAARFMAEFPDLSPVEELEKDMREIGSRRVNSQRRGNVPQMEDLATLTVKNQVSKLSVEQLSRMTRVLKSFGMLLKGGRLESQIAKLTGVTLGGEAPQEIPVEQIKAAVAELEQKIAVVQEAQKVAAESIVAISEAAHKVGVPASQKAKVEAKGAAEVSATPAKGASKDFSVLGDKGAIQKAISALSNVELAKMAERVGVIPQATDFLTKGRAKIAEALAGKLDALREMGAMVTAGGKELAIQHGGKSLEAIGSLLIGAKDKAKRWGGTGFGLREYLPGAAKEVGGEEFFEQALRTAVPDKEQRGQTVKDIFHELYTKLKESGSLDLLKGATAGVRKHGYDQSQRLMEIVSHVTQTVKGKALVYGTKAAQPLVDAYLSGKAVPLTEGERMPEDVEEKRSARQKIEEAVTFVSGVSPRDVVGPEMAPKQEVPLSAEATTPYVKHSIPMLRLMRRYRQAAALADRIGTPTMEAVHGAGTAAGDIWSRRGPGIKAGALAAANVGLRAVGTTVGWGKDFYDWSSQGVKGAASKTTDTLSDWYQRQRDWSARRNAANRAWLEAELGIQPPARGEAPVVPEVAAEPTAVDERGKVAKVLNYAKEKVGRAKPSWLETGYEFVQRVAEQAKPVSVPEVETSWDMWQRQQHALRHPQPKAEDFGLKPTESVRPGIGLTGRSGMALARGGQVLARAETYAMGGKYGSIGYGAPMMALLAASNYEAMIKRNLAGGEEGAFVSSTLPLPLQLQAFGAGSHATKGMLMGTADTAKSLRATQRLAGQGKNVAALTRGLATGLSVPASLVGGAFTAKAVEAPIAHAMDVAFADNPYWAAKPPTEEEQAQDEAYTKAHPYLSDAAGFSKYLGRGALSYAGTAGEYAMKPISWATEKAGQAWDALPNVAGGAVDRYFTEHQTGWGMAIGDVSARHGQGEEEGSFAAGAAEAGVRKTAREMAAYTERTAFTKQYGKDAWKDYEKLSQIPEADLTSAQKTKLQEYTPKMEEIKQKSAKALLTGDFSGMPTGKKTWLQWAFGRHEYASKESMEALRAQAAGTITEKEAREAQAKAEEEYRNSAGYQSGEGAERAPESKLYNQWKDQEKARKQLALIEATARQTGGSQVVAETAPGLWNYQAPPEEQTPGLWDYGVPQEGEIPTTEADRKLRGMLSSVDYGVYKLRKAQREPLADMDEETKKNLGWQQYARLHFPTADLGEAGPPIFQEDPLKNPNAPWILQERRARGELVPPGVKTSAASAMTTEGTGPPAGSPEALEEIRKRYGSIIARASEANVYTTKAGGYAETIKLWEAALKEMSEAQRQTAREWRSAKWVEAIKDTLLKGAIELKRSLVSVGLDLERSKLFSVPGAMQGVAYTKELPRMQTLQDLSGSQLAAKFSPGAYQSAVVAAETHDAYQRQMAGIDAEIAKLQGQAGMGGAMGEEAAAKLPELLAAKRELEKHYEEEKKRIDPLLQAGMLLNDMYSSMKEGIAGVTSVISSMGQAVGAVVAAPLKSPVAGAMAGVGNYQWEPMRMEQELSGKEVVNKYAPGLAGRAQLGQQAVDALANQYQMFAGKAAEAEMMASMGGGKAVSPAEQAMYTQRADVFGSVAQMFKEKAEMAREALKPLIEQLSMLAKVADVAQTFEKLAVQIEVLSNTRWGMDTISMDTELGKSPSSIQRGRMVEIGGRMQTIEGLSTSLYQNEYEDFGGVRGAERVPKMFQRGSKEAQELEILDRKRKAGEISGSDYRKQKDVLEYNAKEEQTMYLQRREDTKFEKQKGIAQQAESSIEEAIASFGGSSKLGDLKGMLQPFREKVKEDMEHAADITGVDQNGTVQRRGFESLDQFKEWSTILKSMIKAQDSQTEARYTWYPIVQQLRELQEALTGNQGTESTALLEAQAQNENPALYLAERMAQSFMPGTNAAGQSYGDQAMYDSTKEQANKVRQASQLTDAEQTKVDEARKEQEKHRQEAESKRVDTNLKTRAEQLANPDKQWWGINRGVGVAEDRAMEKGGADLQAKYTQKWLEQSNQEGMARGMGEGAVAATVSDIYGVKDASKATLFGETLMSAKSKAMTGAQEMEWLTKARASEKYGKAEVGGKEWTDQNKRMMGRAEEYGIKTDQGRETYRAMTAAMGAPAQSAKERAQWIAGLTKEGREGEAQYMKTMQGEAQQYGVTSDQGNEMMRVMDRSVNKHLDGMAKLFAQYFGGGAEGGPASGDVNSAMTWGERLSQASSNMGSGMTVAGGSDAFTRETLDKIANEINMMNNKFAGAIQTFVVNWPAALGGMGVDFTGNSNTAGASGSTAMDSQSAGMPVTLMGWPEAPMNINWPEALANMGKDKEEDKTKLADAITGPIKDAFEPLTKALDDLKTSLDKSAAKTEEPKSAEELARAQQPPGQPIPETPGAAPAVAPPATPGAVSPAVAEAQANQSPATAVPGAGAPVPGAAPADLSGLLQSLAETIGNSISNALTGKVLDVNVTNADAITGGGVKAESGALAELKEMMTAEKAQREAVTISVDSMKQTVDDLKAKAENSISREDMQAEVQRITGIVEEMNSRIGEMGSQVGPLSGELNAMAARLTAVEQRSNQ